MIEGAVVALESDPALFFRGLYPALFAWVARVSGAAQADVEDLVQETLLQAWASRDRYRGDASPETWVTAIARNKIRDRWRARPPALALPDLETALAPGVEDSEDVRGRVRRALADLPPEYARMLHWRYLDGLPVRAIAERLGEGEKAAESRLHRAREAFRDLLKRKDDVDA